MHELSIAQGLLDLVRQHVPEPQRSAVRSVEVRVGRLSGVVPDSLEFCFEALVHGSPLDSARLAIELVPVRCVCEHCNTRFEIEDPLFRCPACGTGRVRVESGSELQLARIELCDSPTEAP